MDCIYTALFLPAPTQSAPLLLPFTFTHSCTHRHTPTTVAPTTVAPTRQATASSPGEQSGVEVPCSGTPRHPARRSPGDQTQRPSQFAGPPEPLLPSSGPPAQSVWRRQSWSESRGTREGCAAADDVLRNSSGFWVEESVCQVRGNWMTLWLRSVL